MTDFYQTGYHASGYFGTGYHGAKSVTPGHYHTGYHATGYYATSHYLREFFAEPEALDVPAPDYRGGGYAVFPTRADRLRAHIIREDEDIAMIVMAAINAEIIS